MTDNEIVGEQIKAKQETLAWRNAYKTKFEQDEPFTDLDLSAWLAIQDVLGMKPRRKRIVKESDEVVYQHAWVDGEIATLKRIQEAITNRIGGK